MTNSTQPPTGQGPYAPCPVCGRTVALRPIDGKIRRHGFTIGRPGSDCRGSGANPARPGHIPDNLRQQPQEGTP